MDKKIQMPILPEYQASWKAALACLWSEPAISYFIKFYIRQSGISPKIIFDIGSNHGIRSYPFMAYGHKCILFEPQKECNDYVRQVAEINNYKPTIEECAISDREGKTEFFISEASYLSGMTKEIVESSGKATKAIVNCTTLDAYCSINNISPDLIKIDVEGHEWQVLCGAEKIITRVKPIIIIEIWAGLGYKRKIYDQLTDLGYGSFTAEGEKIVKIKNVDEYMNCQEPDYIYIADHKLISLMAKMILIK